MINSERLVQTFLALVQIDSPSGDEAQIGAELTSRLERLGLEVERDAVGNLVGRLPARHSQAAPLLLSAHMDTVGSDRGIQPQIHDGVITSDGRTILGADDKSGVAVILECLACLAEQPEVAHPPLEVVISVGEERALWGVRQMDVSRLIARRGLVLDYGEPIGTMAIGAPSQDYITATVQGRAAHAGAAPEKGISAIRVAAEAIAVMPLGRIDAETTSNMGMIQGGDATNIVPALVTVQGEARSRNDEKLESLTAAIARIFREAAARHSASVEVEVNRAYHRFRLAEDDPLLRLATESARRLGFEPRPVLSGGGSDANVFARAAIPCVILSTGMENVHTRQEQIAIADLANSAAWTLDIVMHA